MNLAAAPSGVRPTGTAAVTVITQLPADVAVQLLSEAGWRVSDGRLGGC